MTTIHPDNDYLERRVIVGTLAIDSNPDIAAEARRLLGIEDSVVDCINLTAGLRQLMAEPTQAP